MFTAFGISSTWETTRHGMKEDSPSAGKPIPTLASVTHTITVIDLSNSMVEIWVTIVVACMPAFAGFCRQQAQRCANLRSMQRSHDTRNTHTATSSFGNFAELKHPPRSGVEETEPEPDEHDNDTTRPPRYRSEDYSMRPEFMTFNGTSGPHTNWI